MVDEGESFFSAKCNFIWDQIQETEEDMINDPRACDYVMTPNESKLLKYKGTVNV